MVLRYIAQGANRLRDTYNRNDLFRAAANTAGIWLALNTAGEVADAANSNDLGSLLEFGATIGAGLYANHAVNSLETSDARKTAMKLLIGTLAGWDIADSVVNYEGMQPAIVDLKNKYHLLNDLFTTNILDFGEKTAGIVGGLTTSALARIYHYMNVQD